MKAKTRSMPSTGMLAAVTYQNEKALANREFRVDLRP